MEILQEVCTCLPNRSEVYGPVTSPLGHVKYSQACVEENMLLASWLCTAVTLSGTVLGSRDFTLNEKDTDPSLKELPLWHVETQKKHRHQENPY